MTSTEVKTTKGRCLCGSVEVLVKSTPTDYPTLCCHCTSCKRRSGGLASYAFCIPKDSVISITGSSHHTYSDPDTGSGKPMQRSMCTKCGSPVCIIEGHQPDVRCLQFGLFAGEVELPKPELELFWKDACVWEQEVGRDVRDTQ